MFPVVMLLIIIIRYCFMLTHTDHISFNTYLDLAIQKNLYNLWNWHCYSYNHTHYIYNLIITIQSFINHYLVVFYFQNQYPYSYRSYILHKHTLNHTILRIIPHNYKDHTTSFHQMTHNHGNLHYVSNYNNLLHNVINPSLIMLWRLISFLYIVISFRLGLIQLVLVI